MIDEGGGRQKQLAEYEICNFEAVELALKEIGKLELRELFGKAFDTDTLDDETLNQVFVNNEGFLVHASKAYSVN